MSTTIDNIITEARYDLRDRDSSLYIDAELLYYSNRALRQLDNVLSALNSDWVYNEDSAVSLGSGDNYCSVPSSCIVIRSAWISSNEVIKETPKYIYDMRKYISATGQPYYFAESGATMIFERTADDDYTIKAYYDKRATAFVPAGVMPYNNEFNDPIREMIVTLARKRQEDDITTDSAIYNFFMGYCTGNIIRRNHISPGKRLDF